MKVIEIVRAHLEAVRCDGLVQVDADCGCLIDDLAPCSSDFSSCEPGYRGVLKDDPTEWAMYRTREAARQSVADAKKALAELGEER